jgi:hypothetical protein
MSWAAMHHSPMALLVKGKGTMKPDDLLYINFQKKWRGET